jgi:diguanylate cyclase (GGDEF)-like protein
MDESWADPGDKSDRDFSGLFSQTLIELLRSTGGEELVASVLAAAGETRTADELEQDCVWSSYGQLRRLLEAASQGLGGAERLGPSGDPSTDESLPVISSREGVMGLGSPNSVLEALGSTDDSPVAILFRSGYRRCGETTWQITCCIDDRYEPFPELCYLTMRMFAMVPGVFGFSDVRLRQLSCQCEGDAECVIELHWEEGDELRRRLAFMANRSRALEERLSTLQTAVGQILSDDDLDTVLNQVVVSAAEAVGTPGFVLALRDGHHLGRGIYTDGVDQEVADQVARQLEAGANEADAGSLIAEIKSARRSYGWLAALGRDRSAFLEQERAMLESYAWLAASALDVAVALDTSRRETSTARALLQLAESLAEVASTEQMAARLARAVPEVIDCDRAVVVLIDPVTRKPRIAATAGYEPEVDRKLRSAALEPHEELYCFDLQFREREQEVAPWAQSLMQATGSLGRASVPIVADGQHLGFVIATVADRPERLREDEHLSERLHGLAAQAATALRNATLLDQIRHQALHDALTGLPNRALLEDRVSQALAEAKRDGRCVALLFLDLDRFKNINDSFGHEFGDVLIRAAATRIRQALRESDTLARMGGDEFVVALPGISGQADAQTVAAKILEELRRPLELGGRHLYVSASIGMALYPDDGADYGALLQRADGAMYTAKASGGATFARASAASAMVVGRKRLTLETDLHRAIEAGEITVEYQPQVSLADLRIVGAEALVRWDHPRLGRLQPADFLTIAEECALMPALDRRVRQLVFAQAKSWRRDLRPLTVSVNLSPQALCRAALLQDFREDLDASGVDPSAIEVEITEGVAGEDHLLPVVEGLADMGVRIAIDDFGTGASVFSRLQRFPLDTLKIDRSLVQGFDPARDAPILEAIIRMSHDLGLVVVAEGVEDPLQGTLLREKGCDIGQGFLYGRPMAPADIERITNAQSVTSQVEVVLA